MLSAYSNALSEARQFYLPNQFILYFSHCIYFVYFKMQRSAADIYAKSSRNELNNMLIRYISTLCCFFACVFVGCAVSLCSFFICSFSFLFSRVRFKIYGFFSTQLFKFELSLSVFCFCAHAFYQIKNLFHFQHFIIIIRRMHSCRISVYVSVSF